MAGKVGKERTRQYRDLRRAAGYREATVWLDPVIKDLIDQAIKDGDYRSPSDVIAAAANVFFKEKLKTMA